MFSAGSRRTGVRPSLHYPIVVENAMNPGSAHFAHGAVGENRGVFDRNVSLIIETIRHPAAQCFRRKPAFIHRDVERMFVVISAPADRAQFFDEGFAVPESGGHKTFLHIHNVILIVAKNLDQSKRLAENETSDVLRFAQMTANS